MQDFAEIEFVIPVFTPDTMPLDRLLQYLQQIGDVVGVANEMHLVRMEASSTKPVFRMPATVAFRAREQAASVQRGDGTAKQRTAYMKIRQMVCHDGGTQASLRDSGGVILDFPSLPTPSPIVGIRQATTFDGELLRVGGQDETNIPVLMRGFGGDIQAGLTAPRGIAKAMAPLIFEPVRVTGIGSWSRSSAGVWTLDKMLIQAFERLDDDLPLTDVFDRLKRANVAWPEDADDVLLAERESAP